ncbi:MAG: hypothetical protein ACPL7O_04315 [Armatimonadota bacterium]
MCWLLLHYQPTTLFSLRSSLATSSVGRSLIIPTPYAIKMAFVDAAFRAHWPDDKCQNLVKELASVEVRIKPGDDSLVSQTIQKIRQEQRKERGGEELYISSVAYREIVFVKGTWIWAFNVGDNKDLSDKISSLAPVVNYVGKRGSMLQFCYSERIDKLDTRFFSVPMTKCDGVLPCRVHIATLDDFGPKATFEYLNSFDPSKKPKKDRHRVFVETLIPAGIANSGPGFTHYSMGSYRAR